MTKWKKGLSVILSAGLLAAAFSGSAWAAETRTKISSVTLTIDSDIEAGDDSGTVDVTCSSSTYSVTDVDIINDDGEWVSGDVPKVEITLEADDDYYFASMSSSKVKLKGDDATYVSSKRQDSSSTLIITVKLGEVEGTMEIEDVTWENDDSPIATWEEAAGAKSYQVRLYRGSSSVGEAVTTTNTYYNFASKITRTGEYYFKVRAVSSSSKKGEWFESDYIYVDDDNLSEYQNYSYSGSSSTNTVSAPGTAQTTGTWLRNDTGWWYQYPDGSYPTNGWLLINNVWYCFDSVGYMRTGWIQAGNAWYYCDTNSGAMLTNTRTPDGYYVDGNGVWIP